MFYCKVSAPAQTHKQVRWNKRETGGEDHGEQFGHDIIFIVETDADGLAWGRFELWDILRELRTCRNDSRRATDSSGCKSSL